MYEYGSIVGGGHALVILILRECIWNLPAVSLVLPPNTGSLGYLRVGGLSLFFLPWVSVSRFFQGNSEAEVKTHHFLFNSTFPCFPVFPLLNPQRYSV